MPNAAESAKDACEAECSEDVGVPWCAPTGYGDGYRRTMPGALATEWDMVERAAAPDDIDGARGGLPVGSPSGGRLSSSWNVPILAANSSATVPKSLWRVGNTSHLPNPFTSVTNSRRRATWTCHLREICLQACTSSLDLVGVNTPPDGIGTWSNRSSPPSMWLTFSSTSITVLHISTYVGNMGTAAASRS